MGCVVALLVLGIVSIVFGIVTYHRDKRESATIAKRLDSIMSDPKRRK